MKGYIKLTAMGQEEVRAAAGSAGDYKTARGCTVEVALRDVKGEDKVHLLLAVARALEATPADMMRLLLYYADKAGEHHGELSIAAEVPHE